MEERLVNSQDSASQLADNLLFQVFLHTPYHRTIPPAAPVGGGAAARHESKINPSSSDSDVSLLSFGQHITALTAGKLDPSLGNDVLLIGSQTNLLVYDVEKNSELYYKEVW